MTDIAPPPPADAPIEEQRRYYQGLLSIPADAVSAPALRKLARRWLLEHPPERLRRR